VSKKTSPSDLPYRPCVGILLLNREGLIFAGQRVNMQSDVWQMPQGGIDEGEAPRAAALRELAEETGIATVEVIGESRDWHRYDLPEELLGRVWRGRYRGQEQKWFVMRFLGSDGDVDLDAHEREFRTWQWMEAGAMVRQIIPFKRAVYAAVVEEFATLIKPG
jgi:putative (di)nucleoside polyphosphate hydrolase